MKAMFQAAAAVLLIGGLVGPAQADEVEESLEMALEAYRAGDVNAAKEEIDFAAQLLAQMKAAGLSDFLPEPLPDWSRVEGQEQAQAAGMFGGGMSATGNYTRGNDRVEVQIMADNQMVTAMAAMFANPTMMGSMGQVKRIKRQKVVITQSGELQAMIDNHILIQITGRAPMADKEAYFAAIDLRGLKDF